ncbi:hypothetical protein DERF_013754 [Dermatophagoides farinae]|uniref:Uncharacterized protein n=1 Tax=Dermatophagoides farinae TaxID=6954 RepID=A0A922HN23_DERFA|nr:hypothetical protein DERF_013754 [Dermatophagoides farinae]
MIYHEKENEMFSMTIKKKLEARTFKFQIIHEITIVTMRKKVKLANRRVLILDNFVSAGTFGIQSRRFENALLIDCVRRRSFLFAERRFVTTFII